MTTQRATQAPVRTAVGPSARRAPSAGPDALLAEAVRLTGRPAGHITNQDVINVVTQRGRVSFDQGARVALRYGVDLNSLVARRRALFAPPRASPAPAAETAPDPLLPEQVRRLARALPRELRGAIDAHVSQIRSLAVDAYEGAIAAGATEAQATAHRQATVVEQLRRRRPLLDRAIADLDPPLGAEDLTRWRAIRAEVDKPGLYTKALIAAEAFEETISPELAPKPPASAAPQAIAKKLDGWLRADPRFGQRFLGLAGFYQGGVTGRWSEQVSAAAKAHLTEYARIRARYGEVDARSEAAIVTLLPRAQIAARQTLHALNRDAKRTGLSAQVIWGTRTYEEQNALYAKVPKVTNARGGFSNHNFGIAFDIGLFRDGRYIVHDAAYLETGRVVKRAGVPGLGWGGDWKRFVDKPHYQLQVDGRDPNVATLRQLFEAGQPLHLS